MRQVRLQLWQMLLIVALVLGVAVDVLAGLRLIAPHWDGPWLLPLLVVAAADAVATQRVATRQRLSLPEQGALRAVEWTLLLVLIRLASLSSEDGSLLERIEPWLRDPLTFFGGNFGAYLVPAVLVWLVATGVAQAVLALEVELPREGVRSLPAEEQGVLHDQGLALTAFDRMWLLLLFVALLGAAASVGTAPLLEMIGRDPLPLVGVLAVLLAGLLLHSQGQIDLLHYGWRMQQVDVAADVGRRWRRIGTLLIVGGLLSGVLLANVTLLAPPPPLIPAINALLVVVTLLAALMVGLLSLALLPFAWLLSLFTSAPPPRAPQLPPLQPPQITTTAVDRPLLPALIFWGCVLLLLGFASVRYVQQRGELRTLLGRWRGTRWLLRWLGGAWSDVQGWGALAASTLRRRLQRRRRPAASRRRVPRGAQAQLRALYARLLRGATSRGIATPRSRTPYELRAALHELLPPAAADVAGLTDAYVAAEYGPRPAQPDDVRRARRHWRRLERALRGSRSPRRQPARTRSERF